MWLQGSGLLGFKSDGPAWKGVRDGFRKYSVYRDTQQTKIFLNIYE